MAPIQDTKETYHELYESLKHFMEEEKPYTEAMFNRKKLAYLLSTNEKYLQNAIKEFTGLTVSEFITLYRLKHAQTLLDAPQKYTIEAIALDSGFGSRSTFHRLFRKYYDIAPNEYRNKRATLFVDISI